MRLSRAERSLLADWWFSVDRVLLVAVFAIIGAALVLSLAASPATALKRGLPAFYYAERHASFVLTASALMLAVSLLTAAGTRRLALAVLLAASGAMIAALLWGPEINGAKRWAYIMGYSFQPSEFAKPAFIVLSAWLLAEAARRPDMPALAMAVALFAAFAALLILQPDIGQILLITLIWGCLLFLAGRSGRWVAAVFLTGAGLFAAAYTGLGYFRSRVDRFLAPASGDTYQSDRALQSFIEGGFFGRGPGEGAIKFSLPDARSDFIFAVIAEEYGVLVCLVILGLFAMIAVRVLANQRNEPEPFQRLAGTGLALLITLQAILNMAVNVGLVPVKGITLPFISSGGSSALAMGLTMGMLLAVTRRRADAAHVRKPALVGRPGALEPTGPSRS
jgi:cell division protein FtsW